MATRMLIDARHSEETRVAVLKGNRIEEFDFESAEHKQIKGNIYLAKVTRVEPSLQAAFVDFGGNRHGFLAFSEIHPDYYQIPAEDRAALLAEEQAAAEEEAALRAAEDDEDIAQPDDVDDEDDDDEAPEGGVEEIDTSDKDNVATIEDGQLDESDTDEPDADDNGSDDGDHEGRSDDAAEQSDASQDSDEDDSDGAPRGRGRRGRSSGRHQGKRQSGRGSGSRAREIDDVRAKRQALRRRYKIQDVIQRRQVLLVQVVKEERGNKGAALTTYLSLAGRYCVLMPNSSHGGGISRKISSGPDRKRLKQIVSEMSLPKSMGLIVRTAGLSRTKTEIKRDFDYLARLWDEIRERTLGSSAPNMIHTDSDLIKRAIRDLYNREIDEVMVEGEDGYKAAKSFMKLLMPSHARRVKNYADPVPLFQRFGAEDQLTAMYDPMVQLKSGGYLIINPTEALVSIDINSGRSTKEHGIEQTALHTNLEAAREIARQLRLRDMAGLVVIDFIDMEHNSNARKVERAMKDALKNDRARIQVGRISGFGLMEMSRQRLRTGVLEATTRSCPHCDGSGLVRTASSAGLSALRLIEDEAAKGKGTLITLYASTEASVYLLNSKRSDLGEIEERYGVTVEVKPEGEDEGAKMRVGSSGPKPTSRPQFEPVRDDDDEAQDDEPEDVAAENGGDGADSDDQPRKRRRRRRGGRGRNRKASAEESTQQSDADEDETSESETADEDEDDKPRRRRRRGGRGRKRDNGDDGNDANVSQSDDENQSTDHVDGYDGGKGEAASPSDAQNADEAGHEDKPKRRRSRRKTATEPEADKDGEPGDEAPGNSAAKPKPKAKRARRKKAEGDAGSNDAGNVDAGDADAAPADSQQTESDKPRQSRRKKSAPADDAGNVQQDLAPAPPSSPTATTARTDDAAQADADQENGEQRRGWWQRTFGA